MRLPRRLDIAAQLPPSGPARAAVIGSPFERTVLELVSEAGPAFERLLEALR